jgi:hypothetical protein
VPTLPWTERSGGFPVRQCGHLPAASLSVRDIVEDEAVALCKAVLGVLSCESATRSTGSCFSNWTRTRPSVGASRKSTAQGGGEGGARCS